MSIGKRMLLYSDHDPQSTELQSLTQDWGCMVTSCGSSEEFRGKVEGGEFDFIVLQGQRQLRGMISDADPEGAVLTLPLAEIEKRHILRVLASTGGNKTRAAKVLGIDTKTLYNKLKAYEAAADAARRRRESTNNNSAIAG